MQHPCRYVADGVPHPMVSLLGLYLMLHLRMNSLGARALNLKCRAIKITEENTGEYLCDLGVRKDFSNKLHTDE